MATMDKIIMTLGKIIKIIVMSIKSVMKKDNLGKVGLIQKIQWMNERDLKGIILIKIKQNKNFVK